MSMVRPARRVPALAALALLMVIAPAHARQAPDEHKPAEAQKDEWARNWDEHLRTDFGWMATYRTKNAELPAMSKEPRVVFMGDSITQGWFDKVPGFFTAGRIGRGIGGQTTPQMLVRFRQDVIDLHPAVVQIMAATNDIAGNTGPISEDETKGYFRDMVELAQAHGIRVILASIPPSAGFPWRPGLAVTEKIERLNAWLKGYAAATGSTYADYWSALQDGQGGMKPGLASDGVHPTVSGYAVMQPVAEAAIRAALAKPAPHRAVIVR